MRDTILIHGPEFRTDRDSEHRRRNRCAGVYYIFLKRGAPYLVIPEAKRYIKARLAWVAALRHKLHKKKHATIND